ncbi:cytosine permease [Novipirellula artificiosorum]|uniref:Permease n=1 Tax=Novipirellula artificiosorum TaxID=2528016 RepID=A0A5C6DIP8_9BACT|nr:cytosine permease [Novipirellula artificiosorum]TWU36085.1 Permease [Novipirellula artificiosorum]
METKLPDYVASSQPVPKEGRMPWFKSTAQTYAGIMLWFVFWQSVPASGATNPGGILAHGLGVAILGVVFAAFICHFACYLAPGLMGMKTGRSLAVVGTSTYGVKGGFLMPGFFMGILQFGWLAVNAYFSAELVAAFLGQGQGSTVHMGIGIVWALLAVFVGIKGIAYVAKVATYLPLIPLVILIVLASGTFSGISQFSPEKLGVTADVQVSSFSLIMLVIANVVGFFATAGAAGVDIASSNRTSKDVHLGGLVGVAGVTIFTGVLSLIIVAGTYGQGLLESPAILDPTKLMEAIMGPQVGKIFMLLLAIAAFPPACFSSFIAAESFKNTLPKVNPFVSCGIGAVCAIGLVLSGKAGDAAGVFGFIGASFGPICGAMSADYLLSGRKWPGPRAGFNPAGWISWAVGFVVGVWPKLAPMLGVNFEIPCPPVAAIIVGFVLYILLAKAGMTSRLLPMPGATADAAATDAAIADA